MLEIVCFSVIAYLLGSIPFGLLITRFAGEGDIRDIGSGNIGATNVLRTGRKELAVLTLLLDMLKGTLAVLLPVIWAEQAAPFAAIAALVGHIFPVWLKFKGGKGVATALGALLALTPYVAVASMFSWLVCAYLLRISSLSALIAAAYLPVWFFVFHEEPILWVASLMILLITYTHLPNIHRLAQGTEPHIDGKK
ncbi:MAG: glycerol-3-phosphate 1-O-acyltransferase PlsY [Bdellovibrionales bacterium]